MPNFLAHIYLISLNRLAECPLILIVKDRGPQAMSGLTLATFLLVRRVQKCFIVSFDLIYVLLILFNILKSLLCPLVVNHMVGALIFSDLNNKIALLNSEKLQRGLNPRLQRFNTDVGQSRENKVINKVRDIKDYILFQPLMLV